MYSVVFSEAAKRDLKELSKRGHDGSVYSRRITKEHRLVYKVYDDTVVVLVLSAFGHYS